MYYHTVAADTVFSNSLVTYSFPDKIEIGTYVEVPMGSRKIQGVVIKNDLVKDDFDFDPNKIKPVYELKNEMFNLEHLDFFKWICDYYNYPLGKFIFEVTPKDLKRPRELKFIHNQETTPLPTLLTNQLPVFEKINNVLNKGFSRFLIHGVTGSGKSIIYLKLIEQVLINKKSVLFMLPEINLTKQFVEMFSKHLDIPIYLYNSSISNSDKWGLWSRLKNETQPCLVIGVRSSVFLPFKNLGLIIVDEEHDSSFKQEDRCPYNGRDSAIKKAQLLKIPIVLGSATPTVENYINYKKSSSYLELRERANDAKLPEVKFKNPAQMPTEIYPFHMESFSEIEDALSQNQQVLVFVNKLGYSNFLYCSNCGHQFFCKNCSIPTRFFKKKNILSCFNCDYEEPKPSVCGDCGNMNLSPRGFGTERLEEILSEKFPEAKIARLDRDEIKTTKALNKRLDEFHNHEVDILIGTQMLSKGHNFPKVNLVLVFGTDGGLSVPDFRANEKVYQMLTQISGRSGRYETQGKVIIHTALENHDIYQYVKNHSFDDFYLKEEALRKESFTPPYSKICLIYLTHKSEEKVIDEAMKSESFFTQTSTHYNDVSVWGPRPALIEKRVNKFSWALMLKSSDINQLHNAIRSFKVFSSHNISSSLNIDIDPYSIR